MIRLMPPAEFLTGTQPSFRARGAIGTRGRFRFFVSGDASTGRSGAGELAGELVGLVVQKPEPGVGVEEPETRANQGFHLFRE